MSTLIRSMSAAILALGLSAAAYGKTCEFNIEGNDAMQFNEKEYTVAADCTEVKVNLKHVGKLPKAAMGHNWVLSTTADMNDVVTAGISAGPTKDYTPTGDKVIAATKLVGGGESDSITIPVSKLKKGEDYSFFCTFPGHSGLMKGKFIYN